MENCFDKCNIQEGDRSDSENYRTVGLTSVLCRILKKVVKKHTHNIFCEKNVFFFFLPISNMDCLTRRPTTLQILSVINQWTEHIDKEMEIDCILIDFQKLFEKTAPPEACEQAKSISIQDFLSERKQLVVRVQDGTSIRHDVTSGIPQGAVLRPLLFVMYMTNLPEYVSFKLMMFNTIDRDEGQVMGSPKNGNLEQDMAITFLS